MFCFVCYKENWGERNWEKNMVFLFEGKGKARMGGFGIGKSGGTHLILSTATSVNTQSFAI